MATNSNLAEPVPMSEGQVCYPLSCGFIDDDDEAEEPALSERGLILICCFLFCAMFWSFVFLWLFR